jgi:hypothetical protein
MSRPKQQSVSVRDKIKAAKDRPEETVNIPEWGVTLLVRGLSALDADSLNADKTSESYTYRLLSLCVRDENGEQVYPTAADIGELMTKSLPIVHRLLNAANRVNGISEDGEKKD